MTNQPMSPTASTIETLETTPNPLMAFIAGGAAMLIGAVVWGAITYFTKYQIAYMSIGVGFLVGFAIRKFGHGNSIMYGILGGALALIGCILGNLLFYSGVMSEQNGRPFVEVLLYMFLYPADTLALFGQWFQIMDVLFYGLAVYFGFRYAYQG